ncbi:hypothetical protein E2562_035091 [Oryza meyeriana var. granulata]|uniref:Uncharacterized protein n=1 Tax=Oryza meyeriana var. granulata TaxID=110450 RepID=A0A6G1FFD4_9ORYZ|nr:hypothetical protein E2562_035091 [Oryza meyeriana var. granulata]
MQQGDATTVAPRRQVATTSGKGRIGVGTTDGSRRRGAPEWREMRKRGGSFGAHRDRRRRCPAAAAKAVGGGTSRGDGGRWGRQRAATTVAWSFASRRWHLRKDVLKLEENQACGAAMVLKGIGDAMEGDLSPFRRKHKRNVTLNCI